MPRKPIRSTFWSPQPRHSSCMLLSSGTGGFCSTKTMPPRRLPKQVLEFRHRLGMPLHPVPRPAMSFRGPGMPVDAVAWQCRNRAPDCRVRGSSSRPEASAFARPETSATTRRGRTSRQSMRTLATLRWTQSPVPDCLFHAGIHRRGVLVRQWSSTVAMMAFGPVAVIGRMIFWDRLRVPRCTPLSNGVP